MNHWSRWTRPRLAWANDVLGRGPRDISCHWEKTVKGQRINYTRWWFQIFFIFTPIRGRFPIWLIFFSSFRRPTSFLWGVKRGSQGETCMYPYRFPWRLAGNRSSHEDPMTRISPYDALMHPWLMEDRSDSNEMTQGSGESRVGVDPKSCLLKKVLEIQLGVGSLNLRMEM